MRKYPAYNTVLGLHDMRPVIKKAPEHPARKVRVPLPSIDPSCVLYLKMDELSGKLIDQSGNGNHGTVTGASHGQSGKFGNALSFDGIDDYVDAGNGASLDITSKFTIMNVD